MRVLPVIDLKADLVVRAVAGRRDEYRPIVSQLVDSQAPADVARAFVEAFTLDEFYVADLDAISGESAAYHLYTTILESASRMIVDAGLSSCGRAEQLAEYADLHSRVTGIVVGLESVGSADDLPKIIETIGPRRAVFSLDLKGGNLWTDSTAWVKLTPLEVVEQSVAAGFRRLIVLDLGDVGGQSGTSTLSLCREVRRQFSDLELIAGGGIRRPQDLADLDAAGCDGALVATALHDGQLSAKDLLCYR